jgi:precorrin-2 dehydrogenase/sirohydrochlorin ferrochelatase
MTHRTYPIALDLQGRACLVVGGGALAAEKAAGLHEAGAQVTVVDPQPETRVKQHSAEGAISLHARPYTPADLDGVYLAFGASEDRTLNARVAADARSRGVIVNAVDDIPNCDFFAVSIVRRGDLQIAISTGGESPAFARWVREYLEEQLPEEFGDLLAVLAGVRRSIKARGPIPPYERWQAAIDEDLFQHLRDGDRDGAQKQVLSRLES